MTKTESTLVEEIKAERLEESKVGAALVLGKIRDMEKKLTELQNIGLPSKIDGKRVADMAALRKISANLSDTRKELKKIHAAVVEYAGMGQ